MIKLKTLKDLRINNDDKCYVGQIQNEAIKHWKEIMKERDKNDSIKLDLQLKAQQIWIEHFFNIKEEDLK